MVQHALSDRPNECCGLLSGFNIDGSAKIHSRWPLLNALQSPSKFSVDPKHLFTTFKEMRGRGEDLVAIYHSHPTSWAIPSRFDHADWNYGPAIACIIVSLEGEKARVRAWSLDQNRHTELEWEILGDQV